MYDKDDETEILIRLLSFGPMIRVVEPESMTALIRDRLKMQKSCGR
jgi:predicted DNA-binding transcriptional regulator YafY